jgi:hypothetical protein
MRNEMTLERLREIVEAYGASPARWPQAERLAAEGLASSSREAQALVADAARFDALLDMAPAEAPSAALTERLMAARPRAVAPIVPARPPRLRSTFFSSASSPCRSSSARRMTASSACRPVV